jgi:hypothetical protein
MHASDGRLEIVYKPVIPFLEHQKSAQNRPGISRSDPEFSIREKGLSLLAQEW